MSGGAYEPLKTTTPVRTTSVIATPGIAAPTPKPPTSPGIAAPTGPRNPTVKPGTQPHAETTKVTVPVRHVWSASQGLSPVAYPLGDGDNVHVSKITLKKTISNAPSTLLASVNAVQPTDGHSVNLLKHDKGDATYLVPPGTHVHDEVLYEHPLFDAEIDLSKHVGIDIDTLRKGVFDIPGSETVIVHPSAAPKTFELLANNIHTLPNSKVVTGVNGQKYVEASRKEYESFLDQYKTNVADKIPQTAPTAHNVTLKSWTNGASFGREVAESAVTAKQRDQLLAADTQHEVVSVLEYEITPKKKN